ncbi:response regulator [Algihabitans albus]|uniref:response regulator n=1 Tax=Algihabitans albus TaxID=2164067 RepID=UPI0013C2B779|nr:response regulator [Algihabitans albus]
MAKILLIDDDEALREVLCIQLQRANHEVKVASDGSEVLENLDAWIGWTDLVITDLFMPERDGIETLRGLRQSCADLPIIVMSGGGRWQEVEHFLGYATRLGATQALQKPFSRRALLEAVEVALADQAERRAAAC